LREEIKRKFIRKLKDASRQKLLAISGLLTYFRLAEPFNFLTNFLLIFRVSDSHISPSHLDDAGLGALALQRALEALGRGLVDASEDLYPVAP
jgi:hypothetical protein